MFLIGGFGYIVPVILFWFFGTAEVQKWNHIETNDTITVQESQDAQEPQEPQVQQHDEYCEKRENETVPDSSTKL